MVPRWFIRTTFTAATVAALVLTIAAQTDVAMERVLIHTAKPYANVVSRIRAAGGRVQHQFTYVDAIAAEIPRGTESSFRQLAGVTEIAKDVMVPGPRSVQLDRVGGRLDRGAPARSIESQFVAPITAANLTSYAAFNPDGYLINDANLNVNPLLAKGIDGTGVIVALIDSGIRPGFPHLESDGSVIGGEDLVGDGLGFSNPANNGHGTFVAGMISANVVFGFATDGVLAQSVLTHCPTCVVPPPPGFPAGLTAVPMLGTAPSASIYALRVFPPTGGASTSTVLKAVERVIELKEKFDAGQPGGLNIQVCNMSLGGSTLFAGRDLFDTAVNVMLRKGIVLTTSASNAGPSSLTIGSPGSVYEALTVGASSDAVHERIVRDLQLGLGNGALFRPFSGTQTAVFSSRGPTADGRPDPDVVANGDWSFGQGLGTTTASVSFAGGTSFSSPTVAGVAALLRQAFPHVSARQIRNAIVMGANPHVLADDSTELDQGDGYVDAKRSFDLLANHQVSGVTEKPHHVSSSVARNVRRGSSLDPLRGRVHERVTQLKPGERADFLYQVDERTAQVVIELSNFKPGKTQNVLFGGDDILFAVHSAKTSSIGDGDYVVPAAFVTGGVFLINDPEPGLLRVTVNGDWTNASAIATDVSITPITERERRRVTARSVIAIDQEFSYTINVPAGAANADFQVRWRNNWSHYPTSDIDMTLIDPDGTVNLDGATLNSPEEVSIAKPKAGTWTIRVTGFDIPTLLDVFELRVLVDGRILKSW